MRGAPPYPYISRYSARIIPADAGSTKKSDCTFGIGKDHPRGCGEHLRIASLVSSINGSSPRMRGARLRNARHASGKGIIPADAGSTCRPIQGQDPCQDHPRGCGEHGESELWVPIILGSSPRMRGARSGLTVSHRNDQDHPRGCGEHRRRW